MSVEKAQELVDQYEGYFNQGKVVLEGLDKTKSQDRLLVLEIALRGKTVEEYFDIVDGLMHAADGAEHKEEAVSYNDLAGIVMGIGERHLGIDWS